MIFFNILSVPGTTVAARYYAELEEWFYANYPSYAGVRVEWTCVTQSSKHVVDGRGGREEPS